MCHNGRQSEDVENTCFRNIVEYSVHFRALITSGILVATGPQRPTAFLAQSFWMAVAPPIFVSNKNWSCLEKP